MIKLKKNNQIGNLFSLLLLSIIFFFVYFYRDDIIKYMYSIIYPKEIIIQKSNEYKVNYNFNYIKETDNFIIKNEKEFLDAFYTILNNGWNDFKFYCDNNYLTCQEDINRIIKENISTANINNFVSPFNEYESLSMIVDSKGEINIKFIKGYKEEEIDIINDNIDKVINEKINNKMSDYEKVLTLHDLIINNSKYGTENALSNHATGIILYGNGNCSAYTDLMALFLNKLNIPNYRIASNDHTWNLVYIDNEWKHIDLTWDDPVIKNADKDILTHDYFLINTKKLFELDKDNHNFNKNIYIEAN